MQQPEIRRDSAKGIPTSGTQPAAAGISPESRAKAAATAPPEPVEVLVDEVAEGPLGRARLLADELDHGLLNRAVRSPVVLQTLNNALMDVFRERRHRVAYELLFELNTRPFALIAARIMRRGSSDMVIYADGGGNVNRHFAMRGRGMPVRVRGWAATPPVKD